MDGSCAVVAFKLARDEAVLRPATPRLGDACPLSALSGLFLGSSSRVFNVVVGGSLCCVAAGAGCRSAAFFFFFDAYACVCLFFSSYDSLSHLSWMNSPRSRLVLILVSVRKKGGRQRSEK
jgi:hypothetical protein